MVKYEYDDGGKAVCPKGKKRKGGNECVVRALAILTGEPYREVYKRVTRWMMITTGNRSLRYGTNARAVDHATEEYGLTKVELTQTTTLTQVHNRFGDCMVSAGRHVVALKGGALRDTFDSRTYMKGRTLTVYVNKGRSR